MPTRDWKLKIGVLVIIELGFLALLGFLRRVVRFRERVIEKPIERQIQKGY